MWQRLTYLASRPVEPLTFRFHVYRGARFPEALVRVGKEHFGVSTHGARRHVLEDYKP